MNVPQQAMPFVISKEDGFTGSQSHGPFYPPPGYRGLRVSWLPGSFPVSHSFTVSAQVLADVNPATQAKTFQTVLTSATQNTNATPGSIEIYPGASAVSNVVAGRHVGQAVNILVTHTGASEIPYRIRGEWLP